MHTYIINISQGNDYIAIFQGSCKGSSSISINYRVFSDENLSNFKNSLQDINLNPVLINEDADEAYNLFQSTLLSVFNEHFPIHTKNISSCGKSKPWITPGILAAIRRKRRLEKKARQNPERFLTEYRRHRNLLTKVTRRLS